MSVKYLKRVLKGGGGVPIPFPSSYFFQIPLRNSQIPFPCLIFNIFFSFPVSKIPVPVARSPFSPGQNLPIAIPILSLQDSHNSHINKIMVRGNVTITVTIITTVAVTTFTSSFTMAVKLRLYFSGCFAREKRLQFPFE